jgi:RNA polymerase sigma-70 factor (ECF subfamily)
VDEDDASLVLRARGGESEAFSRLVERHWCRLVRVARSIRPGDDAEDLVQESLVQAWKKLDQLDEPAAFGSWALRIVSRRALRGEPFWRRFLPLRDAHDPGDPREEGERGTMEVERILARLPVRQRAVMHLTVVEGMSDGEIGRALGIEPSSVRSHRRRARENLREILAGDPSNGRKP